MIYTKPCDICHKIMEKPYKMTISGWNKRRFCSQKCNGIWKKGKDFLKTRLGKPAWNRGKKLPYLIGNTHAKGYHHSEQAKKNMSLNRSGEKHWDWKGNNASYSAIHKWLVKNYGIADHCDNKDCLKINSKRYEYALKIGFKYTHNRECYAQLCIPCHRSYDSRLNKLNVRL